MNGVEDKVRDYTPLIMFNLSLEYGNGGKLRYVISHVNVKVDK